MSNPVYGDAGVGADLLLAQCVGMMAAFAVLLSAAVWAAQIPDTGHIAAGAAVVGAVLWEATLWLWLRARRRT